MVSKLPDEKNQEREKKKKTVLVLSSLYSIQERRCSSR